LEIELFVATIIAPVADVVDEAAISDSVLCLFACAFGLSLGFRDNAEKASSSSDDDDSS
jgi:hypothetical protein